MNRPNRLSDASVGDLLILRVFPSVGPTQYRRVTVKKVTAKRIEVAAAFDQFDRTTGETVTKSWRRSYLLLPWTEDNTDALLAYEREQQQKEQKHQQRIEEEDKINRQRQAAAAEWLGSATAAEIAATLSCSLLLDCWQELKSRGLVEGQP